MAQASGNRVYRVSGRNLVALVTSGVLVLAILISIGQWGHRVVPVALREPGLRFLACYLPLGLAGLVLLLLLYFLWAFAGKQFRLSGDGLNYTNHGRTQVLPWDLLTLTRGNAKRRNPLDSALVSDGKVFVRIERALFQDFDELVDAIDGRRRSRSSKKLKF